MGQNNSNLVEISTEKTSYKKNKIQQITNIPKITKRAITKVLSNDLKKTHGIIKFAQDIEGNVHVHGELEGLPSGIKAFHIHESATPGECCSLSGLGGHYNPFNKEHGGRTIIQNGKEVINHNRHYGDLGNIIIKPDGTSKFKFTDSILKLDGPYNIIGRSIVIHGLPDDLGLGGHKDSKVNGHAGSRIAWGVIVNA